MALCIGVNALYLIPGGVGGTEIYLRNLLAALADAGREHRFILITNRETTDLTPEAAPNMQPLPQAVPARIRPARILWEQAVLPAVAARYRFDVLFNPGFTAPIVCPCPQVTVFHDLQHKRHPEYFRWFDLPFWNMLLFGSVKRSARLVAVSEPTRQDLLKFYGSDAAVIPHGVEPELFEVAGRRQPERFILCVSTLHPHKGIESLLDAFAQCRARQDGFRLVLAGMRGFAAAAIEEQIAQLHLTGDVEVTGWISRERLIDLYRRAYVFVYPSRFEGFGMPPAEAMAAGVPIACSDIEPLRWVCGDAAEFFQPGNAGAIASALDRLIADADLRARLAAAGHVRAAAFTWRSAAEKTLTVLESAARGVS
jgi:glycosyltransferase involved in cell wall biosynthesis